MTTTDAARLRLRAAGLRALARRLTSLRVLDLHRLAGVDTWVGPSPEHCADAMRLRRTQLLDAADELVADARRLERRAAELEAAAAPTGPA